ncbi:Zn(2)-C6 fungal-type domain-containing protein [Fusarium keratoplasticum]|nr:Zn(2)-C6 fungal-type domain-containing protein [Fusarium keratoplasticum]
MPQATVPVIGSSPLSSAVTPSPIIAYSPQTDASSPCIASAARKESTAGKVHRTLASTLEALAQSPESIIEECIEMSMPLRFPPVPVIQQETLEQRSHLLLPASRNLFEAIPDTNKISSSQGGLMRDFSLLAITFAGVCCRMPHNWSPTLREALITAFLEAARGMMACYEDWDVGHANSTSLVILTFQSSVLHHLGKTRASWLVMGQAIRLAIDMRVYDEASYQNLDPLESKLRRNIYGLLYVSDMSASILNNKPLSFHEICLDETYTPVELYSDFNLFPAGNSLFEPLYEQQLHQGFYLCHGLWKSATNILLDMKLLSQTLNTSGFQLCSQDPSQQRIMQAYMSFCGILDSLPAWLRDPGTHLVADEAATAFQQRTFWYQRADIVVTFHCLRLVLLQRAAQKGLCALLGLTDDLDMLVLRKIEIASDLASATTGIPFEALQANGEPLVEKLRQVGVSLLEIAHQNENTAISGRAQSLLSTIMDIIARLDSRVSDELSAYPGLA